MTHDEDKGASRFFDGDGTPIDPVAFPGQQRQRFWSSTRDFPSTDYMYYVDMYDGDVGTGRLEAPKMHNYVRCVR